MGVKVTNNATTTTVGAVSSTALSLTVASGTGALFPVLGGSDYFYATLSDTNGNYEVVKVTARTDDVMTIVRAQEGTLALPFPANSRIELRVTAASITDMIAEHDQASEITFTPTGGISATNVQSAIAEVDSESAKAATLAGSGGAALIGNAPSGTVSATTVQGAINEIVSDLASSTGASLVGANDSSSGSIFTTIQGFITYLRSTLGGAIVGVNDSSSGSLFTTLQGFITYLAGSGGAARIGKAGGGTVQDHITAWSTKNFGVLPAGTTAGLNPSATFSGDSGGTTDFRHEVQQTYLTGTNSVAEVDQVTAQLELQHTAGTLTSAFGRKAYVRLGLAGSITGGAVTSVRVYDTHVANEGNSAIGTATCYFADGVDLLDGSGAIGTMAGFYAGDQGHATRVTSKAVGFRAGNMTAGAPFTAAFHSEMADGANKWAFYSEGSAPSQFTGKVGVGSATRPVDTFEVFQGYAKLCASTTKLADGSYHEMRSQNTGEYIAKFSHSDATNPNGIHIKFSGGIINDTSHRFLLLDDTAATRLQIFANGNVQNANNSYAAISDARLKVNVTDAPTVLDKFRARRFVEYNLHFDPDANKLRGVIAQDEQGISPSLVSEDDEGNLSFNYAGMAVETGQAVKELLSLVDSLVARIAALEAR